MTKKTTIQHILLNAGGRNMTDAYTSFSDALDTSDRYFHEIEDKGIILGISFLFLTHPVDVWFVDSLIGEPDIEDVDVKVAVQGLFDKLEKQDVTIETYQTLRDSVNAELCAIVDRDNAFEDELFRRICEDILGYFGGEIQDTDEPCVHEWPFYNTPIDVDITQTFFLEQTESLLHLFHSEK